MSSQDSPPDLHDPRDCDVLEQSGRHSEHEWFTDFETAVGRRRTRDLHATVWSVAVSAVIYAVAVGVLIVSFSIPRPGWGGGPGVPGAIVQPIVLLIALGLTVLAGIFYLVLVLIALFSRSRELGWVTCGLAIFALAANVVQLAFSILGPPI